MTPADLCMRFSGLKGVSTKPCTLFESQKPTPQTPSAILRLVLLRVDVHSDGNKFE